MGNYSWSVDSAIYQVKHGEKGSERTDSADAWLYALISSEAQAGHALTAGAVAVSLMDALKKEE